MYPEWIQLSVDSLNERVLEGDLKEGQRVMNKIYTERRPKELIDDGEVFDLIKKLLVEENILMEIKYTSKRINISFTKKV